jgi:large subunit ribosomal protein L13
MGGLKSVSAAKLREHAPEKIIIHAVKGMLPKNRLSNRLITKLKVYAEADHPHEAQKPIKLEV